MNRYWLLLRRFLTAKRLGFTFVGTSKTRLPRRVTLGGRTVDLTYPADSGYMSDIINLWLDDEYGIGELKTKPATVVDIGGNIGLFSLWVWGHFPNTQIHTFEPNPRVFDCLTENLIPTGAQIHRAGVSHKPGRAEMNDISDSRLASTIIKDDGNVELIALSQIVEDVGGTVDLLKMDCEGAEWEIFKDAESFKHINAIRMEYHLDDSHSFVDLKQTTECLGYKMTHHLPYHDYGIAWFDKK